MLDSAVVLLRERGANALTVDAVLAHSDAPRGSVYYHFPGGRDEIILAATTRAGGAISTILEQCMATGDTHAAVDQFIELWKRALRESDFHAGCPVVGLAIDSRTDVPDAAEAVRRILDDWHSNLIRLLVEDGYSRVRARRLATMIVASIEGALILCRAKRSVTPLNDVSSEIHLLLNIGE